MYFNHSREAPGSIKYFAPKFLYACNHVLCNVGFSFYIHLACHSQILRVTKTVQVLEWSHIDVIKSVVQSFWFILDYILFQFSNNCRFVVSYMDTLIGRRTKDQKRERQPKISSKLISKE